MVFRTRIRIERRAARWRPYWLALACCFLDAPAAPSPQILYFEPLRIEVPASSGTPRKLAARDIRHLELTAFGRQFSLAVESNENLRARTSKPASSSLQLYRGEIQGIAGSWVRLATVGGEVHGMLWDGHEAYVIAPSAAISHELVPPLIAHDGTVVFRLADVIVQTPELSCASKAGIESRSAAEVFEALALEMQAAMAGGATQRLELVALADSHFLAQYADKQSALDSMLVRLNIVDGIFSTQVGVQIQVPSVEIYTQDEDPFSATTNGSALLDELASLRRRTPALRSRGLTHLFTGRRLAGTTIGIGYIGTLCDATYGAALTEVAGRGLWHEALVAAHEIGHNFGAVHDGQRGRACASTPEGVYLMSPNVNGSERFSQCSLDLMRWNIPRAQCITPLPPADLSVAPDLGTWRQPVDVPFDWTLPVVNRGGAAAFATRAELVVPQNITVEEAFVDGGTCLSGAGVVQCELGAVPGGASRSVNLRLRGTVAGTYQIAATVSAQGEAQATSGDNSGSGTLEIAPLIDLALHAEAPQQVRLGDSFDLRFTLLNDSDSQAAPLQATIELPAGFDATQAHIAGGECTRAGSEIHCTLAALAARSRAGGSIRLSAREVGTHPVRLRAHGAYINSDPAQETVELSVQVAPLAATSATPAARSGGGGGALGCTTLLLLLGLLTLRLRR
jgi:hypothetical protein